MPIIAYEDKLIQCPKGSLVRDVLIAHGIYPHNGSARNLNCFGLGSCGTCAVKITGNISPATGKEKLRLSCPPLHATPGLRLSCQTRILGDIKIEKGKGFWGQKL